jgi:hypothetical protein
MEVVLDHLHARRHRDVDAVAATLHPQVVHQGVRPQLEILDGGPDQAVLGVAGPRFRDVEEASPNSEVYILMTVRDSRIIRMRDFRAREDALAAARGPLPTG